MRKQGSFLLLTVGCENGVIALTALQVRNPAMVVVVMEMRMKAS
jgi:hypothetical protein